MKILIPLLLCLIFWGNLDAETQINSDILSSQTWNLTGSPYIISGSRTIGGNAVVTIEAGVQVRFNANAMLYVGTINSAGGLEVNGTEADSVAFTANSDSHTPGFWNCIYSYGSSTNLVHINHAIFEYGGSSNGIYNANTGNPQFTNCAFRYSANYAIHCELNTNLSVSGSTFTHNAKTVSLAANDMKALGTGNQYTGNTDNRIHCRGGSIRASSTWTTQSTPIYVLVNMTSDYNGLATTTTNIQSGSILEFASGTSFAFGNNYSGTNGGILQATGVTLRGEQATSNFWRGLNFQCYSGPHLLSGCTISDAGYTNGQAVYINCINSTITGCTISNCSAMGVYYDNGCLASLSANTITGCGSYPLSLPANSVRALSAGNNFTGNGINRVQVRSSAIYSSGVWPNPGVPYALTTSLTISNSSPFPHIKILPGAVIMLPDAASLNVGYYANSSSQGSLEADGVIFTRSSETAIPIGLIFYSYLVSGQCVFTNCTFEHMKNSTYLGAIYVAGAGPTFNNCIFRDNPGSAIVGEGNTGRFTVNNCSFLNNGSYPIKIGAINFDAVSGAGNTFSGNNPNRIFVAGATLNANQTYVWNNPGVPAEVSSDINVNGTTTSVPILKINSGLVLLFRSGTGLNIGYYNVSYPGGIQANGATFSALSGTSGGWNGLTCQLSITGNSYIRNCIVEYGGSNGNIYIPYSTMPVIESCVIRNGAIGINISGNYGVASVIRNYIVNNIIGVKCSSNANPIIGGSLGDANSITGNTSYGVQNTTSSLTVNAEYNWWGDASGPYHATNPTGTGNPVSNYVDFIPWRTTIIGDSPSRFYLLLPVTASVLEILTPLLTWEESIDTTPGDVVTYTVELALNSSFTSGLITYSGLSATFLQVPSSTLADDTHYFWRVKATDTQNQTTLCYDNYFYFDTAVPEAPLPFNPLSPAYNATVNFTSNLFVWEPAIDPDAGDMITYTVYRDLSAGFEFAEILATSATSIYSGFCSPGSIYYWKVQATDLTGRSTFSPTWQFYVNPDAKPRAPAYFNQTVLGSDLQITWDAVPGADSYDVYFSTNPYSGFSLEQNVSSPLYLDLGAASGPRGFYRVVSIDSHWFKKNGRPRIKSPLPT